MTLRIPGRVAFLVPWPRHWIVGTTDKPHTGPVDRIAATAEDVDEILGTLNGALELDLTRDDLVGTYAGLRPLIAPSGTSSTVKVSREHRVSVEAPGLVRVSGGKYTTYRVMARDAVDAALGGEEARRRPSRTRQLPIHGAAPRDALDALAARLATGDAGAPRGRRRAPSSTATGPRRRRSSPTAPSTTSSGSSSRARRTSRPRSPGPRTASSPSRSTTSSPGGSASSTRSRTAASRSRCGWRRSPATCSAGTRIARPRRSRRTSTRPAGSTESRADRCVHAAGRRSAPGREIGYRHRYGMCVDCPRARHRARLRLDRTFDTLVSSGQHLQRGRPGQRRRQTEEIGTWPTRP